MTRRKLPPYGKQLLQARLKGLAPTVLVVAIDDWNFGKLWPRCVVAPELDPSELDFSFVAGVDCTVIWQPRITPHERMLAVCSALIEHEARRIWVLNSYHPHHSFFAKSVERGVELPELIDHQLTEVTP